MGSTPDVSTRIVTALSRAIRRNTDRIAADLAAAARGDRDAIHDVRVASRRLRAALPIAGDATGVDVRTLARDVRRLTRALSGVREAHVVHGLVRRFPTGSGWTPAAVARLDTRCARQLARERRAARAALARTDVTALEARLRAVIRALEETRQRPDMALTFVAETRRRARALAEAAGEAGVVYAVEPLHRMRLAAKKLRYLLEVGSRALPGVGARATRRLRRLQSQLGDLHDLQMAQLHVRAEAAAAGEMPPLAGELANLDNELEVRCRKVHARVLRTRAGLDDLLRDVEHAAAGVLVPRAFGSMARMPAAGGRRRAAAR